MLSIKICIILCSITIVSLFMQSESRSITVKDDVLNGYLTMLYYDMNCSVDPVQTAMNKVMNISAVSSSRADESINNTMTTCFNAAVNMTNVTDPSCVIYAFLDLMVIVKEVQLSTCSCVNQSYSKTLIGGLNNTFLNEIHVKDIVVNATTQALQNCTRYSKNPNQELKCMSNAWTRSQGALDGVEERMEQLKINILGLINLLEGDINGCINQAEEDLSSKCSDIQTILEFYCSMYNPPGH